jgi:phosphoribosylformylglycinamidine synthase
MKVAVKVLPRPEVLDTQGRAVEGVLKRSGHAIDSCRVGKYIIVDVKATDPTAALTEAKKMAEEVLYNPLIESFEVEVLR